MGITDSIEKLSTNSYSRIVVAGPNLGSVNGFITSELSINGSNEFSTPLESQAQKSLSDNLQAAQAVAGRLGIQDFTKFTLQTVEQSVAVWSNSSKPTFSVSLLFIAIKETDDVRTPVANLFKTVYPTFEGFALTSIVKPPLGYLPNGMTASGVFTVQVGKWFRAPGQIMNSVDFTFSKETIKSGAPLYATGTIQFTPFRMIEAREIANYILVRN